MSRSLNKVILVGNVGRDPEIRTTSAGTKVTHVSLATSRRVSRNDEDFERTEWHRLTLWDRLAQFAEDCVRRGQRLYVEGRLECGSFERNDGVTIPTAEIVAHEVLIVGDRQRKTNAVA